MGGVCSAEGFEEELGCGVLACGILGGSEVCGGADFDGEGLGAAGGFADDVFGVDFVVFGCSVFLLDNSRTRLNIFDVSGVTGVAFVEANCAFGGSPFVCEAVEVVFGTAFAEA